MMAKSSIFVSSHRRNFFYTKLKKYTTKSSPVTLKKLFFKHDLDDITDILYSHMPFGKLQVRHNFFLCHHLIKVKNPVNKHTVCTKQQLLATMGLVAPALTLVPFSYCLMKQKHYS